MRMLYRLLACLLFISAYAEVPNKAEVDKVLRELSEITGFEIKHSVACESMTRQEWNQWLEQELKHRVKPEEIRAEEIAMKKFGLVPQDFDLRKTTIELLTEQAAAFYDHRKKKMVFVEGAPPSMASAVLGHELAHALADQHFHLGRFMDAPNKTDDAQAARLAVVEGQAMWLIIDLPLHETGNSLTKNRAVLDMAAQASGAEGMFPVFDKVPLYLRESLIFPYREGTLFQQSVVEKLGQKGFAAVLRSPPQSTQQIIHADKYFDHVNPTSPELPHWDGGRGWRPLTDGTLGELDVRLLLEQYTTKEAARAVSIHLRGARFDLVENRAEHRVVLRWAAEWDSPETATCFLTLYRQVLAGKWKRFAPAVETGSELSGAGDDGAFRIVRRGAVVEGLEGLALY